MSDKKTVEIYTDGSCLKNPGPGGWGAVLIYGGRKKELSGGERDTTNNRMELTAAIKALEALDNMGILDKAYMRTDQLSGGQMQRVALARTLAQNPKIILADEPVAALDPVTARQVMDDFKKINKEMNISVLINIHHVDLALEYVDRIIGIKAGKIVYDGKASDIDNEVLKEIYGGDLDKVGSSEDLLKRE